MEIRPYGKNAKKHPKKQVEQVANSIKEFGMNQPIVVDKNGVIIVGHGRYEAIKSLGWEVKPDWVKVVDLTDEQANAYRLADNKLNESEWDMSLVIEELKGLSEDMFDLTGFDKDLILEPDEMDDEVPEVPEEPKSVLGDLYELGVHRLLCGSATNEDDIKKVTQDNGVEMIYTDPPYGMNYSGRGKNTSNRIMNDDIDPTDFYNVLPEIQERYIWGRVENYKHLLTKPRDTIIWKKNNFGMGRGYRGQYECCFYYGQFSGSDTDVWEQKKDTDYTHPTQKPVELACRAIRNSKPTSVIDAFAGSGSTLLACEKMGIKSYHIELDPKYVDVIVQRYVDYTGNENIKLNGKEITWKKTEAKPN
jgi:site-specific DNA-methyltransferase (adenine-specific)